MIGQVLRVTLITLIVEILPAFAMDSEDEQRAISQGPPSNISVSEQTNEQLRAKTVFKDFLPIHAAVTQKFEEYFRLNSELLEPLDDLGINITKMMHSNKVLGQRDWEIMYFSLWSLFNVKGIEFIQQQYGKTIEILKNHWPEFDPTFTRPITEFGFFPNEKVKVTNPVTNNHKIIIFGSSSPEKYSDVSKIYRVNIVEDVDPDLRADMNNHTQLQTVPNNHFEIIQIENVPLMDFFNPAFFQLVKRFLKDEGELLIPYNPYPFEADFFENRRQHIPYEIPPNQDYLGVKATDFFLKNGFDSTLEQRSFYLKESSQPIPFWVLKKK